MKKVFLLFIMTMSIILAAKPIDDNTTQPINTLESKPLDDWEYNATREAEKMFEKSGMMMRSMPMPSPMAPTGNIGLAVGGAKDTNNFKENIDHGFLPKLDSITYEGQFYQHFFDTALKGECNELFCPSYVSAKRSNPFTKEEEVFLSVGLNSGIKASDFKRKKLNLVIVLDISGSMGSSFDQYYYDKFGNRQDIIQKDNGKSKMKVANESIVAMLSHLKGDDRSGMVVFDDSAYRAMKLNFVAVRDMDAIKKHILEIQDKGGTNWSAGYKAGVALFDGIEKSSEYENRIIFLTDAMPNLGELNKEGLFGMAEDASKRGIHTTFVGVGVDFNNDLVEFVSKIKGANYYSVHSSEGFAKVLDDEFEYMVTPLVYDLSLKLESKAYAIDAVYGSPDASKATGEIMKINTLFPSKKSEEATKGGVVLLKLKKMKSIDGDIILNVTYKDQDGISHSNKQQVVIENSQNSGIRKAILVSDYVNLMKNWLIDSRADCHDQPKWVNQKPLILQKRVLEYPSTHQMYLMISEWERASCPVKVSDGYKKLFSVFAKYYEGQMKTLKDDSLNIELDIVKQLINTKAENPKNDNQITKDPKN
ncbi:MAG: VWA domain-containing protein [Sulfurovaceae bacterium]|nr:VWA domain-containing protein [Sulfurovaceae bacterium]